MARNLDADLPEQIDLVYQSLDTCTYYFLCCDLDPKRERWNAQTTEQLLRRLFMRYLNHRKDWSCKCSLTDYCRGAVPEPTPSNTHPPVKINTVGLQQFLLRHEPECPTTPAKSDAPSKHTKPSEVPRPTTPAKSDALSKYTKPSKVPRPTTPAKSDAPSEHTKPSEAPCPATPVETDEQSLLTLQEHTKLADGVHDTKDEFDAPPKYTELPERAHDTRAKSRGGSWFGSLIRKLSSPKNQAVKGDEQEAHTSEKTW
ncbi:hypothetical protein MBLNU457_4835t1 [Dothideomycetes sp. NU457]